MSKDSNVEDAFDVNIQPDVTALRMFRSMSFTPWYALGEFVDNSITSAMKNHQELVARNGQDYQLRIQIDFPADADELIIKDNAAGISRLEMQRALQMGKAPQDISIGLSRHGVGISEWFHGRFLHLPGIAVIASDRSMDFLSRPTRSATGNGNSQGSILTEVVRDNGFVRWPQSQFSEAYLQARWAGQVSLQKGGPVEILP